MKYEKKHKDLTAKIEALANSANANDVELAAILEDFDALIAWTNDWMNDIIIADETARAAFRTVFGNRYALPWD